MTTGLEENFASNHIKQNYDKHTLITTIIREILSHNQHKTSKFINNTIPDNNLYNYNNSFSYQYTLLLLIEIVIENKTNNNGSNCYIISIRSSTKTYILII
ncbi:MAG: hypothetical protein AB8U25_04440 [Rickettsiales endosymbiont of Dermacentor nuttalli]